MYKLIALLALLVNVCLALPPAERNRRELTSLRLPNTTVPTHYDLYLDTDVHLGVMEYSGNVRISITVLEDTNQIVLHSLRNDIHRLELSSNQLPVPVEGFELDAEKEFLVITTSNVLVAGTYYVLDIDFSNSLDRDDKAGFYVSSYETEEGETRYLGVTQFEPCDARTAFPCYDEPSIKTTYNIKIACGLDYNAKANSPALGVRILPGGKKLTTFQTTPRMQSYIVAFLVSDFITERQISKEPHQIAVSTLARPTAAHLLSYSVDASVKFLRTMEEYFGQSYAMSKMDNVAVNDDHFWAGAMENWGLVTYRESAILFDPETQPDSDKVGIVSIIAHEYVHQFFGNLLAPKWWSFVWLNEGFANLYQFYLADISHPETNMRERFGGVRETALRNDGDPTIRAMTHYVEDRNEVKRLFDGIAYSKSASVLHMFNYVFTETTFQKGLRYYIQQNKDNGVVEDQDLFDSLQQAVVEDARLPLSLTMHEVFSSWSNQPGAPLVTVTRVGTTNEYLFTQERFFTDPQETAPSQSWWIPITYSTSSGDGIFWMPPGVSGVSYEIDGEQIMFDPESTGYYRINYDPQTWTNLIYDLYENTDFISRLSRSRLIDDSMQLAHAGKLDYGTAFKVIDYLQEETEFIPWATAASNFEYLHRMLRHDEEVLQYLESYVAQLAEKLLVEYGFDSVKGESADAHDARMIALRWACNTNQQCREEASKRIETMRKRSSFAINSKSDQQLVCNELRRTNYGEYATMVENLRSMHDQRTRSIMIDAITCAEDKTVINDLLVSLSSNDFKEIEKLQIIQNMFKNSNVGLNTVIEMLSNPEYLSNIKLSNRNLPKLLQTLADYVVEPAAATKLIAIVQREAPTQLLAVQAKLRANQSWIQRNAVIVSSMLKNPAQVDLQQ
ncbi:aminopeptidase N-like [Culex pipiens pallens]|nr:aminopeptidase N-like [Culex pipiens pallens]